MLLVISTKGCHLHTWGEETIIGILLVQNFTSVISPWPLQLDLRERSLTRLGQNEIITLA